MSINYKLVGSNIDELSGELIQDLLNFLLNL